MEKVSHSSQYSNANIILNTPSSQNFQQNITNAMHNIQYKMFSILVSTPTLFCFIKSNSLIRLEVLRELNLNNIVAFDNFVLSIMVIVT